MMNVDISTANKCEDGRSTFFWFRRGQDDHTLGFDCPPLAGAHGLMAAEAYSMGREASRQAFADREAIVAKAKAEGRHLASFTI